MKDTAILASVWGTPVHCIKLTGIGTETQVTPPVPRVDEGDERVNVRPTGATPHYHPRVQNGTGLFVHQGCVHVCVRVCMCMCTCMCVCVCARLCE